MQIYVRSLMNQLNNSKLYLFNHKHFHLKIISNFFSGLVGVGIGLIIGSYLGWL
ncbi:MAG: hypothetical protein QNJ41_19040 [Xenococcaceae cyanobacterium MO_188.B32]|nr:hypothetical protein [Xenococcaceae cyanobacterium MO_188.B32]